MRAALAQLNPTVGDFAGNCEKILAFATRARDKHCDLAIFSELCVFGYPPNDLLEREHLVDEQTNELKKLHRKLPAGITALIGVVRRSPSGKPFHNSACVLQKGKPLRFADKQLLPAYDIFDEGRYFEPGGKTFVFSIGRGRRIAVTICEDMWMQNPQMKRSFYKRDPFASIKKGDADFIINLSASPFSIEHEKLRQILARRVVGRLKIPFIYVNQVGGQDEVIFDGNSFVLDEKGKVFVEAASFEEDLVIVDFSKKVTEWRPHSTEDVEKIRSALVLGLRDFVFKTGQKRVHLGLSGGIDSAVVACLAVDALGPGQVTGVLMPGPYSSKGSIDDSLALAKRLKIKTLQVPITKDFESISAELKSLIPPSHQQLTFQNLQARLRGLKLMALSNGLGSMLLCTGNKSEIATGYTTIYGDMCGGIAPIGDLTKEWVYRLAHHYNSSGTSIIPQSILEKAPSAELKPHQKDSDNLPEYDQLDPAVEAIVEQKRPARGNVEKWVLGALYRSEFKRWQSPPILRVTTHAFGRGRRFPIAHKAKS